MGYIMHKWISTDDDAVCVVCGMHKAQAIPAVGRMVSCERDEGGTYSWPVRHPYDED